METKKIYTFLFGILIIATFFRTYHLESLPPGLYPDEAMNGNNALEALRIAPPEGGFKVYYPENNGREGLFMNIQAMFLKYLMPLNNGLPEPWMLRLPSAIFGTLTVLGMFWLVAMLFSPREGLLASFFLATNFWHINFSRIGFRAITAPFFMVWASAFLLYAIKHPHLSRNKRLILGAIGGIFFGLGFHSYISFRVMPLALLLFIPFFYKEKDFWRIAGAFTLTTVLVGMPILSYYLGHTGDFLGRTSQISVFSSEHPLRDLSLNILKTAAMFNFWGDFNTRHNFPGRPELFWPAGIFFIGGFMLGIRALWTYIRHKRHSEESRHELFPLLFAGLWFALAALPVVISNEGLPHALRAILMIPPVFIFASVGATWIAPRIMKIFPKRLRILSLTLFFALCATEAYVTYFAVWGNYPDTKPAFAANYVTLARYLNSLPREVPKYVIVQAGGVIAGGFPVPAQTVMFLTDTYRKEWQDAKNLHYVLPEDAHKIKGGIVFELK